MATDDQIGRDWHALCFGLKRSIRYHEKREAYFLRLNAGATATALIFGSGAVAGTIKQLETVSIICGTLVAVVSYINLVAKSSEMARKHERFREQYCELLAELDKEDSSIDALRRIRHKRLMLEAKEPPVRRIVDLMCHNELLYAEGFSPHKADERVHFADIGFFKRLTSGFVDWDTSSIRCLKANQQSDDQPNRRPSTSSTTS